MERLIDKYIEEKEASRRHNPYRRGIKGLSWQAREIIMFEQSPLTWKKFDDMAYRSGIGWHAMYQINDPNYRRAPGKLYGLDLNSFVDLRVTIHKTAITVANDQFLIEEIYFNHKEFLVKKLAGKKHHIEDLLEIVETYLSGEKISSWNQHYDILARREAAGGRELIVTYKVLLEDLIDSI